MSFVGPMSVFGVITSHKKNFKILVTEQEGGFWVATVLYSNDGQILTKHFYGDDKAQSYKAASS